MKPLTGDEYNNVFDVTGIDVDGRREILLNFFIPNMESCVKRFVNFVKAIPGFTQLPLCDQIALVKGTCLCFCAAVTETCGDGGILFRVCQSTSVSVCRKTDEGNFTQYWSHMCLGSQMY